MLLSLLSSCFQAIMSMQRSSCSVLLLLLLLFLVLNFRSQAQVLPDDEVQILQTISSRLNIREWNVNKDSCRTGQGLNVAYNKNTFSNVTCDCTFNNATICHVTNIKLKNLSINGELPVEFANLTYLCEIDLTRNYFNGSIPRQWASLPLVILTLLGNLVGGTIPREIGTIHTLEELVLQDTNIGGPLPHELGNLVNLRRAFFTGSNFTGELPGSFGNLRNLTDFWIDGSSLSGRIPDFIGNWTKMVRLDMQGTSMEGPIPSTISQLTNLKELRISDLNVANMTFPNVQNLTNLTDLVLRNCSIIGSIPLYIGQRMQTIKKLDLSFNRLTGPIPENMKTLANLQFMYLTNNSLTGPVSKWLQDGNNNFDISYNNFTGESDSNCQATNNLNKISSYSPESRISWCFKKGLSCPGKSNNYELFINCGGPRLRFKGKQYEQETAKMGASSFYFVDKWACSTTGDFLGAEGAEFIASTEREDENIYSTARLAPFSLKYYGRCLQKGSYTVKLHFAEIMLTTDLSNNTRGKRIFNVYIQGDRVLTDFNIAEEAGGIRKGIVREYNNITVVGSTLEIHLYWAGKGSIVLPVKGSYGPLISAISVTPNFNPSTRLSAGAIAGIVVSSFVAVLLILAVLWKMGYIYVWRR